MWACLRVLKMPPTGLQALSKPGDKEMWNLGAAGEEMGKKKYTQK